MAAKNWGAQGKENQHLMGTEFQFYKIKHLQKSSAQKYEYTEHNLTVHLKWLREYVLFFF